MRYAVGDEIETDEWDGLIMGHLHSDIAGDCYVIAIATDDDEPSVEIIPAFQIEPDHGDEVH